MSIRRTLVLRSITVAAAASAIAAPGASALPIRDRVDSGTAAHVGSARVAAAPGASDSPAGHERGGTWWTVALGVGGGGVLAAGALGASGRRRAAGRARLAA
jgi:hypothetical protein